MAKKKAKRKSRKKPMCRLMPLDTRGVRIVGVPKTSEIVEKPGDEVNYLFTQPAQDEEEE